MKKIRSLRSELIYDLSLLTFCSLILSSGLLVLLIRLNYPTVFQEESEWALRGIHHDFVQSLTATEKEDPDSIQKAFDRFRSETNWGASSLQLQLLSYDLQKPIFESEPRSVLVFFQSLNELSYKVPLNRGMVLHYRLSFESFHHFLDQYKYIVFLASLLIAGLLVGIGYQLLFKKNILIPIQRLSSVANSFSEEDWSARYEVQRNDELGQIGDALNEMARKIIDREKKLVLTIQSLQVANEEIEATKNEQLQIEKLASVGRLAAGVAHEVGNPLGAISGYIDILQRSLKDVSGVAEEDRELLNRIESETNRISRIIRALLQQARPPQDRIRSVVLLPVVRQAVDLAQIPASIEVQYDFETDQAEALCEKDQLVQVLLNLLINARHAIEAKLKDGAKDKPAGRIRIRCAERRLQAGGEEIKDLDASIVRQLDSKSYWMLSITDNGVGIGAEDQNKLFEPFFSTKETGKGTGLGLYVAKSIIESFRGAISVQSEFGFGTSFSIFLPKDL